MNIVDRRLNPKAKSLGNRQRFIRRAKGEIRTAAREALRKRKVSEVEGSQQISISTKSLREPSFGLNGQTGQRDFVLPGNQDFSVGDTIAKPPSGGGSGSKGSREGSGDDDFVFTLTKDEFLDLFFEDLALPNLIKVQLKSLRSYKMARAGFTNDGSPSRLNQARTMRNSLARRIALNRPSLATLAALEAELAEQEAKSPRDAEHIAELARRLAHLRHVRNSVAFVDPIDLRYNRHEKRPKPTTQAVMFCLMDVSASMSEPLKDLAKQFFMLLNVFLTRHYTEVDVVFIRHTTEAQEVDEATFFQATSTGGTVISTALEEMLKVITARYPVGDWNIYAAQASDGHNVSDDMDQCVSMLQNQILPMCQHFAYIEVGQQGSHLGFESVVWQGYGELESKAANFAMNRVRDPSEIYPVFRDLFAAEKATAGKGAA
jgi:uncharacterized protein